MKTPKRAKKKTERAGGRFWDILEWLLLHATFIFSGMFITLWIFNLFNWQMEFLTSKVSNKMMIIYFSTAFLATGLYIVRRAKNGITKGDGKAQEESPTTTQEESKTTNKPPQV